MRGASLQFYDRYSTAQLATVSDFLSRLSSDDEESRG
jgi:hypothetical protein